MPLRPLPYRQVERRLRRAGFRPVAIHGNHVKFVRESPEGVRTVIVPRQQEIAVGTLRSVVRQAGLTVSEFEGLGS